MIHSLPNPDLVGGLAGSERWMVKIFNNDHNSFDEVIAVLMAATGCDIQEAHMEAWEAHHLGQTPVHFDGEGRCKEVAGIISGVGVRTEVCREWEPE
jgi:ATP-dependent Clp protease adaptor protein ClpS